MRFHLTPRPLLHLITTFLLTPRLVVSNPLTASSLQAGFGYNELFARYECGGQLCGWENQLCCTGGSHCYTDSNDEAQCGATAAASYSSAAGGGYWVYVTTTTVMTNYETVTTVLSSFVAGASSYAPAASASASATVQCNYALNQSPCGNICCKSGQYCAYLGQCSAAAAEETTITTASGASAASATPGAPIRPTSSGVVVVTATKSPTTTVPFETPVATGANVTMTATHDHSGGLSGGAIAGIVIGVLIALAILALVCFYCCLKGLLDGCLALFGLGGKKRRRTTEVEEYERHTHHSSRGDGGGRTWYGASKPSRVERRDKRESNVGRDMLGVGAGLAGLWAILGMKRRSNRRKNEEKYSEYSYSSDYYTSASE